MFYSEDVPGIEELSDVMEAVPVHGERVITKALSEAEKALEGTGSLADIQKDDEGVIIEDLINNCRLVNHNDILSQRFKVTSFGRAASSYSAIL